MELIANEALKFKFKNFQFKNILSNYSYFMVLCLHTSKENSLLRSEWLIALVREAAQLEERSPD